MNISQFRRELEREEGEDHLMHVVRRYHPEIEVIQQAYAFIQLLVQQLLDQSRYGAAAELLWGPVRFNPRPQSVKRIWTAINSYHKLILLGASSQGKSYCAIVWMLLDWLRDPGGTSIKCLSTSEGHAKSNVWATMTELYRNAIIPLPGTLIDKFLGLDSKQMDQGIALISIPQGDSGKGRLRGFHPKPREVAHPTLGAQTRVRVLLDECEEIVQGVWDGVDNLCSNLDEQGSVKIICATNPKDPLSHLAELAEPDRGWTAIDLDTDQQWTSKERWTVVRVDAALTENVVSRKVIFPGLMTFEGFENLRLKNDGNSPEYYCFGRGMYWRQGGIRSLIPLSILDAARGNFVFTRSSTNAGSADLAFEGGDSVAFATGRYGLAEGWIPAGGTKFVRFEQQVYGCELQAIYELPNLLTLAQIAQLRAECERLEIPGKWFCLDSTGNATGVADGLQESWDPDIRRINWGESATSQKILETDKDMPKDLYNDLPTEMWFALRRWLECKFFLISPHVQTRRLFGELTKREYKLGSKGEAGLARLKIETKKEFKLGNRGQSPDFADAVVMLLHGCRMNTRERMPMPGLPKALLAPKKVLALPPSPWPAQYVNINND